MTTLSLVLREWACDCGDGFDGGHCDDLNISVQRTEGFSIGPNGYIILLD